MLKKQVGWKYRKARFHLGKVRREQPHAKLVTLG